jgi:hypothetical protein
MNISDHISESLLSLETSFLVKILKFFDADLDPGIFFTLDAGSGMEKSSDPGYTVHLGSASMGGSVFFGDYVRYTRL